MRIKTSQLEPLGKFSFFRVFEILNLKEHIGCSFSCLNYSSVFPYHTKGYSVIKPIEIIQYKIRNYTENDFGN